jgi:hypothetical protein
MEVSVFRKRHFFSEFAQFWAGSHESFWKTYSGTGLIDWFSLSYTKVITILKLNINLFIYLFISLFLYFFISLFLYFSLFWKLLGNRDVRPARNPLYVLIFWYSDILIFWYFDILIFIYSYVHMFIYSYIHLFINSLIHLFIYSSIHEFMNSWIHTIHAIFKPQILCFHSYIIWYSDRSVTWMID